MPDQSFAKPAAKLAADPPNAVAPTGGLGLVLDPIGRVPLQAAINVPRCRVYNTANLVTVSAVVTALTFDTERYDSENIHSLTANTGRLTCQTAGIYEIFGNIEWPAAANGQRDAIIRLNGVNLIGRLNDAGSAALVQIQAVATDYSLAVGDYVELCAFQNTGGNLNVNASPNYSPEFGMTWIGPTP